MSNEYRQYTFKMPPGAAELLLIRHGESEAAQPGKPFPLVNGHGDPALHPNGHLQAKAVATCLSDVHLDALYVTTLRRTHQTAAPLAQDLGMTPGVEADLREVSLGDWDGGLYRIKAAERDPLFVRTMDEGEWGHIPGAETTRILHDRVSNALFSIAKRHADQRVALFVHGGVIGAAMALATGSKPFAFIGAANGSISRIVISGDSMIVRGFNDCNHLT